MTSFTNFQTGNVSKLNSIKRMTWRPSTIEGSSRAENCSGYPPCIGVFHNFHPDRYPYKKKTFYEIILTETPIYRKKSIQKKHKGI